jgi:hypothetical protein
MTSYMQIRSKTIHQNKLKVTPYKHFKYHLSRLSYF